MKSEMDAMKPVVRTARPRSEASQPTRRRTARPADPVPLPEQPVSDPAVPIVPAEVAPDVLFDCGAACVQGFGRIGQVAAERMLRNAELALDVGRSLLACHSPADVRRVQADLMRVSVVAVADDLTKLGAAAADLWAASFVPLHRSIVAFLPSDKA